jgi:beta-mannanase
MRDAQVSDAKKLTRRDFARAAAVAAATAAVSPVIVAATPSDSVAEMASKRVDANGDDAASARQAEIDARVSEVFRRYGDRLSAEQKTEVRRLVGELQKALDKLRAYPLGNGDQPATVLRVVPDAAEVSRAPRR